MEHRWGRRIPVGSRIRFANRGRVSWAYLRDVSISGAFFETPVELTPMEFVLIDIDGEPEPLAAFVVRTDAGGVAVEWPELAPPRITALLESQPALSAIARRENEAPVDLL